MTEEKLQKERERLKEMHRYEEKYYPVTSLIGGIDEAGRGPLCGPVVAACVILPKDAELLYLNDSKKLSEKRRELLFPEIKEKAVSFGVGIVENDVIDEINILNATKLAMKKAIDSMSVRPEQLLIDAVHLDDIDIPQVAIIKGDAASVSIAAASVIAKVTRDHIMLEYDKKYPEYGFAHHKGYGTKAHYEALKKYGLTPIHRKTFLKNLGDH
jgi:ribonuclease HII